MALVGYASCFSYNYAILSYTGAFYRCVACLGKGVIYSLRYIDLLRSEPLTAHMLKYVRELLAPVDAMSKSGRRLPFRSRFGHTERVTEWALRIMRKEGGVRGVIAVAAIFHDSGYCTAGEGHARISANVFRDYAEKYLSYVAEHGTAPAISNGGVERAAGGVEHAVGGVERIAGVGEHVAGGGERTAGIVEHVAGVGEHVAGSVEHAAGGISDNGVGVLQPAEGPAFGELAASIQSAVASPMLIEHIYAVIAAHSDKDLDNETLDVETRVLMDADMLDELGAMSVLWECFNEAQLPVYDFNSAYNHICERYYNNWQEKAGMFHTEEGNRQFIKMHRYVSSFLNGLKEELNC